MVHVVVMLLGAVVLVALVFGAAERAAIGFGTQLVLFLIDAAPRQPLINLDFSIGATAIYPLDIAAGVLVLAAALRVARGGLAKQNRFLLAILVSLTAVHLLRGAMTFGLSAAINGARSWVWFASALAYALIVPARRQEVRLFVLAAVAVGLEAIVGFSQTGIRSVRQPIWSNGAWIDPRPLTAAGALLLLQGLLVVLATRPLRGKVLGGATCALLLLVVLQHRTVWLATAAAALLAFSAWSRSGAARRQHVFALVGVCFVLAPFALAAAASSGTLRASAEEAQSSNSTLHWRTASWAALVREHHSATDVLVGLPAGASWERDILGDRQTNLAPHSQVVEAFLRFGIGGVALLVALIVLAWRRRPQTAAIPAWAYPALLVTTVVFGLSYALPPTCGLLIGMLLESGAADSTERVTDLAALPQVARA